MFQWLHHAQLAMPRGGKDAARHFFVEVLGMSGIEKPPVLAARGGARFRAGGLELHLGIEEDVRPARTGHPGIWDGDFPGSRRVYAHDPFGHR